MYRLPDAFFSYTRFDDQHEGSALSTFRERLSGAVQQHTGDEFVIFQDTEGVDWGQDWQQRIDAALSAAIFFIPILTPSFLKNPHCRREVERFIGRERALGRNDLILPIYQRPCWRRNQDWRQSHPAP